MIEKPSVSIIIPNYNHAQFLEQRLQSVFNQTYQDFEVILLDDASTDNSLQILERYKNHQKVSRSVFNKENSGSPFAQWQKGINLAKGDYIWVAESDDYSEPTFLEAMVSALSPTTVLAYCASEIVNSENEKKGRHKWADALDANRWLTDYNETGLTEIRKFLKYRNTITNASAVIFKKEVFKSVNLPIQMRFCGDWKLWIDILKLGDIAYIANKLNYFRRHEFSTRTIKDFETEQQRYIEYFKIINLNSSIFSRINEMKKYDWILREWSQRSHNYGANAYKKLGIPLDFLIRYKLRFK